MWLNGLVSQRRGRIALVAGLSLTAAVPLAVIFLGGQDSSGPAAAGADRVVAFEAIAARSDAEVQPMVLEAALPEPAEPASEEPAPEAPPVAAPEPEPTEAPPAAAIEPAFAQLAVVDPLSSHVVQPIAFADLPVAETAELAEGEADVPLYVPGSIGQAKRGWAGANGTGGPDREKRGRVTLIGGGGHCPVPGRVPPFWNRVL